MTRDQQTNGYGQPRAWSQRLKSAEASPLKNVNLGQSFDEFYQTRLQASRLQIFEWENRLVEKLGAAAILAEKAARRFSIPNPRNP